VARDTSFYYSFLVLPQRKRHAIIAVWDFCRAVDDAVDEVVPEEDWKGGLTPAARQQASREIAAGPFEGGIGSKRRATPRPARFRNFSRVARRP